MTSPVAAVTPAGVDVVFSDLPHVHGLARQHFLRVGLASQFLATAKEMNGRGWILKLEDCCRTPKMQTLGLHEHMFSAILREMQWECGRFAPRHGPFCRTDSRGAAPVKASALVRAGDDIDAAQGQQGQRHVSAQTGMADGNSLPQDESGTIVV